MEKLLELVFQSIEALSVNKLRTALATLGIIIGIGSVITLISLGQAGQKSVESSIQSLGSNLLTVIPGSFRPGEFRSASGTSTTLTLDDAKALRDLSGVKNVSAEVLRRSAVQTGKTSTNTQIVGVLPAYQEVRNVTMQSGNFISQGDVSSQAPVAVLGPTVVENLFGFDEIDPVGQSVRINKISFRVIGVMEAKGGSGFGGNQDDTVLVPLSTAQKRLFGVDYVGSISVQVENAEQMNTTRDKVGYLLLSRHKIQDPVNADFSIFSQADILGAAAAVTGTFTALLSGIAAISLLVGGIGIMNIMLMSVTERTREIGLRKALGAKKKDVTGQFLIEAVVITFLGGTLGIIIGILASFAISAVINLPFTLSLQAVLLAFIVSTAIGIIFGWYPARKAANLQPIEALRYE